MEKKEKVGKEDKGAELRDYGVIYLSGAIDDKSSEEVCKEIIECNLEGKVGHIQLIINSAGGSCSAGFAIIDMMEWSHLPVYTTGIGLVASMGLLIFMAGERGRRVITPRTSILSHRYSTMTMGNHSQLLASRKEQDLVYGRIIDHYLVYSSVDTPEELEKYLLRDVDTWLSTDEAIKYGLADIVERPALRKTTKGKEGL
ncbi:MAG: ATP-dependent Clp protease proteolytic subunit [Deltaproteobacteria bacterium]|nr:ATP-dependent Clp protease proteolytic subunit [Deltaproteobacteria bacterium]